MADEDPMVTKTGKILTDADIEALADEAEKVTYKPTHKSWSDLSKKWREREKTDPAFAEMMKAAREELDDEIAAYNRKTAQRIVEMTTGLLRLQSLAEAASEGWKAQLCSENRCVEFINDDGDRVGEWLEQECTCR